MRTGQRWSCRTWPSGPAGEPDDLEWLQGWCATLREHVKAGRCVRRARVVSEPLSDYQRWSYSIAYPMVEAGEDIRWVPRRLVSSVALPGNDFYLFDDRLALFLLYTGNGLSARHAQLIRPCRSRGCAALRSRPSGSCRYRTVSTPPSSSAKEAQKALGAPCGEIRKDAGLSGRALAAATC